MLQEKAVGIMESTRIRILSGWLSGFLSICAITPVCFPRAAASGVSPSGHVLEPQRVKGKLNI
jgi:hypothetical protein